MRLPSESSAQATERVLNEYTALLKGVLADLQHADDWQVHVDIDSDPAECILRTADLLAADLILIGRYNRSRIAEALLGSVSEEIVRRSPVPVLLVRADATPEEAAATWRTATGNLSMSWPRPACHRRLNGG